MTVRRIVFIGAFIVLALIAVADRACADRVDDLIVQLSQYRDIFYADKADDIEELGTYKDPRAYTILEYIVLKDRDDYCRAAAALALGQLQDPRAVVPLITVLEEGLKKGNLFWSFKTAYSDAIVALGELRDARAVPVLVEALYEKQYYGRAHVAYALGKIGDSQAVDPLIAVLQGKHRPSLFLKAQLAVIGIFFDMWRGMGGKTSDRVGIAYALGEIGDPRAIEPLIKATRDRDETVRGEAIDALGNFDDPRVIKTLEKIAQNESGVARWSADEALINLKRERGNR